MNKYELAVVVSGKLDEESKAAVIEKAKDLVERLGGTVSDVDDWGKRKLAYEIQKMNEGYYTFIHFEADAAVPAQLEERMRIADDVIRYLVVRMDAE